ncbi:valyl-tRNA synthetase [Seinonella peptonophila]|uniref:Valine--tRNA ligase n=1 Tax=Seinonella peptonophila TaxID=112248 RepID=A0A1M4WDV6_9BACL|nr:valine--tRNA ligase [Seinonella peptonophila]SHE79365.1 valyl-tRNA synthetase [Seinonella peptonophila]
MSKSIKEIEMSTKYDPKSVEAKQYQFWLDRELFKPPGNQTREKFSIVIPPPNVTGMLHIGHALDFTLQDILIRMKRMQGYDTLWLPGMDHAGIATQTKVEEKLREQNKSRHDLGREKFLELVWEWKEEYASVIREQWGKMGFSLDYSRERFTMDEGLSKAVRKVFVDLYNKGLIYRGKYIINWDPVAQTALSDIEVIHKEVTGKIYHLRYPLVDASGEIVVATTRPETIMGDTAVAVHPDDERYQHLIGKRVRLPIVNREIPIIADDYVDPTFGSGAVKITPAHDPNDFEVGQRHHLAQVLVIDERGVMNQNAAHFQGMDRFECRKQIIKELKQDGNLLKTEEHVHSVGHSERSGAVVEPYLSTQWFVKMQPLADQAIEWQKSDQAIRFVPERFEKVYLQWIENVRDWCISRQLWWGHRIPAWHCTDCQELTVAMEEPTKCSHCGSSQLKQDEDVLDTWFSSALWPFSTLGWPDETADLKRYYPTNVLVTGYDIIYFWVARMIFSGLEYTDERPFQDVLMHGIVRDENGQKMSKSLGNGIDPLEVIDQYGADSLRYMISTGSTPGQDQRFRWERVESARNFINKIWNASRFVLMNLDGFQYEEIDLSGELGVADQWVLHRLRETAEEVTRHLEEYNFGEAGRKLYDFVWDEFCDWYIELAKFYLYGDDDQAKQKTKSVLCYVLDQTLRLLHPFMPFVTEEIWQHLPHQGESIVVADWPSGAQFDYPQAVAQVHLLIDIVRQVRSIRAEAEVLGSKKITLLIRPSDQTTYAYIKQGETYLQRFCNLDKLEIALNLPTPEKTMSAVVSGAEIFVPLAGLVDLDLEIERLTKELKKWNTEVERVQKKLANQRFIEKAPAQIVEAERAKEQDYLEKQAKVKARLAQLQSE